jgi:hypothetical protein
VLLVAGCLCRVALCCCDAPDNQGHGSARRVSPFLYARDELVEPAAIEPLPLSVELTAFTGRFWSEGSNESLPLVLYLRFDQSCYPRHIHGHGHDRTGSLVVSEGILSTDSESREQRCCLLLEYANGTRRVLYGQRNRKARAVWFYGQWTGAEGAQQGTFHFAQLAIT